MRSRRSRASERESVLAEVIPLRPPPRERGGGTLPLVISLAVALAAALAISG